MGPQTGTEDPQFVTHEKYYENISRICNVMLIENVPEYAERVARDHLDPSWLLESAVIDPRILGIPSARSRLYILAFDTKTVTKRDDVYFSRKIVHK